MWTWGAWVLSACEPIRSGHQRRFLRSPGNPVLFGELGAFVLWSYAQARYTVELDSGVEDVHFFPCEFRFVSPSTYFYPQQGRLLKALWVCATYTISLGTLAVCLPRLFNSTAIYSWKPIYGFLSLYSMLQCDQSHLPPVLFKSNLQMET